MTKNKRITQLESRVQALERELEALFNAISYEKDLNEEKFTYEEVIDQWLNGKTQK